MSHKSGTQARDRQTRSASFDDGPVASDTSSASDLASVSKCAAGSDTTEQTPSAEKPVGKSPFAKYRFLTSITIVAIFIATLFLVIGLPYYETNDDLTMTHIASGTAIIGEPDEHLIFTHTYIGLLLKHLYTSYPSVPWYGVYETTALFIAMSAITWLILGKSSRTKIMLGTAFAVLFAICVRPLLYMQFTTTATLLAAAGSLFMMECVERFYLRKRAIICAILAVVMYVLASLVRGSSAELVSTITALFIVCRFLPVLTRQWRRMLVQLVAIGIAYAIVMALTWVNATYYQGEWKNFYQTIKATNSIREYRCDSITSPLSQMIYKHVGWKATDVVVFFKCWYSVDAETYSLEKVETVSKLMRQYWKENFDFHRFLEQIVLLAKDQYFVPVLLPALAMIPFLNRGKVPRQSVVLLTVGILALCALSIVFMKLPMRVVTSIVILCTLFAIRYLSVSKITSVFKRCSNSEQKLRTRYATIIFVLMASSLFHLYQLKVQSTNLSKQATKLQATIENLNPKANQLYVRWAWCYPTSCIGAFADLSRLCPANFKALPIGAIGQAPFVLERMKEFGIKDVFADLERDDVFIISNDFFNTFIEMYAAEQYEKETVFTPVPVTPEGFQVFQVKYVKPTDLAAFKHKWELDKPH